MIDATALIVAVSTSLGVAVVTRTRAIKKAVWFGCSDGIGMPDEAGEFRSAGAVDVFSFALHETAASVLPAESRPRPSPGTLERGSLEVELQLQSPREPEREVREDRPDAPDDEPERRSRERSGEEDQHAHHDRSRPDHAGEVALGRE